MDDSRAVDIRGMVDAYEKSGMLHHAYLIEGDYENISPLLFDFFETKLLFPTHDNPDIWIDSFEQFGVDNGRALKDFQSRKAIMHNRRIFVIHARFITEEAQNSLLKMFEEPADQTYFFLIMPSAEVLLPTLRSRLQVVTRVLSAPSEWSMELARKFVREDTVSRLRSIEKIVAEKDKDKAISFLGALECVVSRQVDGVGILSLEMRRALEDIQKYRGYMNGRAPSVKAILEHGALTMPRVG